MLKVKYCLIFHRNNKLFESLIPEYNYGLITNLKKTTKMFNNVKIKHWSYNNIEIKIDNDAVGIPKHCIYFMFTFNIICKTFTLKYRNGSINIDIDYTNEIGYFASKIYQISQK